jgi:hypothetical protein
MLRPYSLPLLFLAAAVSAPAACGARTNLACDEEIPATPITPNLYFVLDHSKSMLDGGKWNSVGTSLQALIARIGAKAHFGAAIFPDPASSSCDVGVEVMSVRPGSAETAATLAQAMSAPPSGGTPTAATLRALLPELRDLVGQTFVILATDGGPNCNDALTCDLDHCTANIDHVSSSCLPGVPPSCCEGPTGTPLDCLDDTATVAAVGELDAAGIPTFVIGVPGSEAYAAVLDAAAGAGGTARSGNPAYYAVTTSDAAALTAALSQVIDQVTAACFLKLTRVVVTANLVVSVGEQRAPEDPRNGFTVDGAGDKQILSLHGAACDLAVAGAPVSIHVLDECPLR